MATVVFAFVNTGTKTVYGKAIMVSEGKEGMLLHIETVPKYRKLGIGTLFMDHIMDLFDSIVTAADSEEGQAFCLKCGFELEKSSINEHTQLVWRKPVEVECKKIIS